MPDIAYEDMPRDMTKEWRQLKDKLTWKPREEYKTLVERHVPILTRTDGLGPMLVVYSEHGCYKGGHFYPIPSAGIYYGDHQFGCWVHDHFDEWMEVPE